MNLKAQLEHDKIVLPDTFYEHVERYTEHLLKWNKIRLALAHRPYNSGSEQHQLFIHKTIALLNEFRHEIDISSELRILESQLI